MCFYPFSPDDSVAFEYVSEVITVNSVSSEIVADVLVRNKAHVAVAGFYLVYPQSFAHGIRASFEDVTSDFFRERSRHNQLYEWMGVHSACEPALGNAAFTLTGDDFSYRGLIGGKNVIEPLSALSHPQRGILHKLGMTVFEVRLEDAMAPGELRWFRWRFCPPFTARNRDTRGRRFLNWLLNNTEFYYRVIGPVNVREELLVQLNRIIRDIREHRIDDEIAPDAINLLRRLDESGLGKLTEIRDWRLHILPSKNLSLGNIVATGDLTACGPTPTLLKPVSSNGEQGRFLWVYQWKAGSLHVPQPRHHGAFEISFAGRPVNHLPRLLPWVALAIGMGSLGWQIVRLLFP